MGDDDSRRLPTLPDPHQPPKGHIHTEHGTDPERARERQGDDLPVEFRDDKKGLHVEILLERQVKAHLGLLEGSEKRRGKEQQQADGGKFKPRHHTEDPPADGPLLSRLAGWGIAHSSSALDMRASSKNSRLRQ